MSDPDRRVRSLDQMVKILGGRSRPETFWISNVTGTTVERAERAVNEVTKYSESVEELSRYIENTGRSYYAQFPAPLDLFALVRLSRPQNLVESGVASGVSSTFQKGESWKSVLGHSARDVLWLGCAHKAQGSMGSEAGAE